VTVSGTSDAITQFIYHSYCVMLKVNDEDLFHCPRSVLFIDSVAHESL